MLVKLSPKNIFLGISQIVQNAQSSSYPKFQIILCKTDVAPKGFSLVQVDLKWGKKELGYGFSGQKTKKNCINQCQNHLMRCPAKNIFMDLI